MGIDTRVSLPGNVRLRDVANVIGVLIGQKATLDEYGSVSVEGVDTQNSPDIPCATIRAGHERFFYHFEGAGGRRGITVPRTCPEGIALARRVVDFFGGTVDYNDCDDTKIDYEVADKDDDANHPDDGEPWHSLQHRIATLKPITRKEIRACSF